MDNSAHYLFLASGVKNGEGFWFVGVKNHSKQIIKSKVEANLKNLDLVNREEFEEIKSMIIKAREQNAILEAKIKTLEKKLRNRK